MSRLKRYNDQDVLTAARERIGYLFDRFERVYLSFSGGKDSTVMLHLAAQEARRRHVRLGVLFIDLEAQYACTIEHVGRMLDLYRDTVEPYWVCLPLILRNAVSQFEPRWTCWDPRYRALWVRELPARAISDPGHFGFFRPQMEFEEFVERFGNWYGGGRLTACMVGIRTDESLNRFRTLVADKVSLDGHRWTTLLGDNLYNAYPIYDWRTEDIWTYGARTGLPQNPVYDLMWRAGVGIHQQRICQPYGDDQRRGLWLYGVLEPTTWIRVVNRVSGANSGALYSRQTGSIQGRIKIDKPDHHTWQSYAEFLLASMPPRSQLHYRVKIKTFIDWWGRHGYPDGIPDHADRSAEASRSQPSWRRIVKVLLKNDYWCKGLGFAQTRSDAYEAYMARKRAELAGKTG